MCFYAAGRGWITPTRAQARIIRSRAITTSWSIPIAGKDWAYLETEERYKYVRDMQLKNLIVPLVADFGGAKTLKTIGQYLKDHGALVSAFYVSNVEDYISPLWQQWPASRRV